MAAPACTHHDDGLHRWRFEVGPWTRQPGYRCRCGLVAIVWDDDDDAAYLAALGGEVTG